MWLTSRSAVLLVLLLMFIGLGALISGRVRAAGPTYDAVAEFSTTGQNPAWAWSYRHSDDLLLDGDYALLPTFVPNRGLFLPSPPGAPMYYDDTFEGVAKCPAGCQLSAVSFVPIDADELWVHPGGDSPPESALGLTVVQFTAAFPETYDIEYSFEDIDTNPGGDGVDWSVAKGASTLASGSVKNASTGLLSLQGVQLAAGEAVNFILSPKGSAAYDSTGLKATVTPRVETIVPGTTWWTLIGLAAALAGLAYLRLKRRAAGLPP